MVMAPAGGSALSSFESFSAFSLSAQMRAERSLTGSSSLVRDMGNDASHATSRIENSGPLQEQADQDPAAVAVLSAAHDEIILSSEARSAAQVNGVSRPASTANASTASNQQAVRSALKSIDVSAFSSSQVTQITQNLNELFSRPAQGVQSISTPATSSTGNGVSEGYGDEIDKYLTLIRALSKDPKALDDFLARFKKFRSGQQNQGQGNSMQATMANITQQWTRVTTGSNTVVVNTQGNAQGTVQAGNQQNAAGGWEVVKQADGTVVIQQKQQQADPLVLDMDGDGIELSTAEQGVQFDINGDGVAEQTAFTTGGDAFLALDRNGNGVIDGGQELFGDQNGAKDGMEELRKFDGNKDGVIDSTDGIFSSLRLFDDKNGDGKTQSGELFTLTEKNITAIKLNAATVKQIINGNSVTAISSYQRTDGSLGQMGEAFLNFIV